MQKAEARFTQAIQAIETTSEGDPSRLYSLFKTVAYVAAMLPAPSAGPMTVPDIAGQRVTLPAAIKFTLWLSIFQRKD